MIRRIESLIERSAASYRADARYLAVIRIAYGAWVLLFPVDILWIASVPSEFVNPRPGLFFFISETPTVEWLTAISIARAVLALLLIAGVFVVPVSILLSAAMIVSAGISYSFSKVDHFILFELVPVFLAFAGWGAVWSIDALRRRRGGLFSVSRGMPVLLFALVIGWAMFSAAVPKILGGWLDPARQATRGYIARDVAIGVKPGPLGEWILTLNVDLFWKSLDYATIAAEGALILFVLTPMLYRLWLTLLVFFHFGVFLTLGISFIDYALVYAVFFSPVVMWIAGTFRSRLRAGRAEQSDKHAATSPRRAQEGTA